MLDVNINHANDNGSKVFQPKIINWSNLNRGNVDLIQINEKIITKTFRAKWNEDGIINVNIGIGNQPPKNTITIKKLIKIIFEYSAKKNSAKLIEEYSTLYPETNSASASGKSNGGLFVSAKAEI